MKNVYFSAVLILCTLAVFQNKAGLEDFYSLETGIYAAKKGASVKNLNNEAIQEPVAALAAETSAKRQEARENTKPFSRVSSMSSPERFESIKADPAVASYETDFWARCQNTHCSIIWDLKSLL